ncbi:ATP-binding protein, partial [Clostridium perfringens]|uniref:AAA family ATPase n=1 Tax=Clostridium perfringens TaxID=1502 RepID=UPI0022459FE6
YLNVSKQVIFIIDEPELSLSILWQKRLIEDIYESGRIALLIATTHSPYIFKNKYRLYAKEIGMFEVESKNDR